jgi:hypothetical protein
MLGQQVTFEIQEGKLAFLKYPCSAVDRVWDLAFHAVIELAQETCLCET